MTVPDYLAVAALLVVGFATDKVFRRAVRAHRRKRSRKEQSALETAGAFDIGFMLRVKDLKGVMLGATKTSTSTLVPGAVVGTWDSDDRGGYAAEVLGKNEFLGEVEWLGLKWQVTFGFDTKKLIGLSLFEHRGLASWHHLMHRTGCDPDPDGHAAHRTSLRCVAA